MTARGLPKRRQVKSFLSPQEVRPLEEGSEGAESRHGHL